MALVKTKRKHRNGYGDKSDKAPGDEYDHPSPSYLAAAGFITIVKPKKPKDEQPAAVQVKAAQDAKAAPPAAPDAADKSDENGDGEAQ